MNSTIYFLRSLDGLCPDIQLKRDTPLVLGRGPLTRVKDAKVSRQHLRVSWDDRGIFVRQLGENPAFINGLPLAKGDKAELDEGQVVYLVSNRFPLKLILKTGFIAVGSGTGSRDSVPCETMESAESKKPRQGGNPRSWDQALLISMNDPSLKVVEKADHMVIKDKFPKARHHFLVLPVERIQNLTCLGAEHAPLIHRMCETARDLIAQYPDTQFRLGFHALPSMSQLHLHVISQDFESPCLKTKKHWNSFTTHFFMNPEHVIDRLVTKGRFTAPEEAKDWLNTGLKCHKCDARLKNMPDLKNHISTH